VKEVMTKKCVNSP